MPPSMSWEEDQFLGSQKLSSHSVFVWSKGQQRKTFLKGCNKEKELYFLSLPILNKGYFSDQKCVEFFSQPTVSPNSAEF